MNNAYRLRTKMKRMAAVEMRPQARARSGRMPSSSTAASSRSARPSSPAAASGSRPTSRATPPAPLRTHVQATRAARRRGTEQVHLHADQDLVPHLSYLARNSVRPETQDGYLKLLRDLSAWLGRRTFPQWLPEVWDEHLVEYLSWMFDRGVGYDRGARTLAAVLWGSSLVAGPLRHAFPQSCQCLSGWRRMEPPSSRPPIPFELMNLLVEELVAMGLVKYGLLVATLFETYMRPSEAFAMRVNQIVPPRRGAGGVAAYLTMVIHPLELEQPGKTNEYDHSIALDLERQQWLVAPLLHLCRGRPPTAPIWHFDLRDLQRAVQEAFVHLEVKHLGYTVYGLRHGGASHDRSMRTRSLLEVQARGAWRAPTSVRRYEKHGRLGLELAKLPPHVLRLAGGASRRVNGFFGRSSVLSSLAAGSTASSSNCSPGAAALRPRSGGTARQR